MDCPVPVSLDLGLESVQPENLCGHVVLVPNSSFISIRRGRARTKRHGHRLRVQVLSESEAQGLNDSDTAGAVYSRPGPTSSTQAGKPGLLILKADLLLRFRV